MGLVSLVYHSLLERVRNIERWKEPHPQLEEILTKSVHHEICNQTIKELMECMEKQHIETREYFNLKIENVILKEIRKRNSELKD